MFRFKIIVIFQARENHIFEIKEHAAPPIATKRRPLMGLSCYGCTPTSRASIFISTYVYTATIKNTQVKQIRTILFFY